MRVITWNRSFRGLNAEEYKDDIDSEENETLATVLDKLLAWEKKLYDEVKVISFLSKNFCLWLFQLFPPASVYNCKVAVENASVIILEKQAENS